MTKPKSSTKVKGPTTSPLRLLILTPTPSEQSSLLGPLLHALTGVEVPPLLTKEGGSFAGYTSHPPVELRTKYFAVDVGIWCDEVPRPAKQPTASPANEEAEVASLQSWKEQMCSDAAREVRTAIGGIILTSPYDTRMARVGPRSPEFGGARQASEEFEEIFEVIDAVNELREAIEDENPEREIPLLALVQGRYTRSRTDVAQEQLDRVAERMEDEWMDTRAALGWEFVGWEGRTEDAATEGSGQPRTALGERTGMARILEAIKLANWTFITNEEIEYLDDTIFHEDEETVADSGGGQDGIKLQSHELEREMIGLKLAMRDQEDLSMNDNPGEEDIQVEQFQRLLERVVAMREAASEIGGTERERFARREVERLMRELG